MPKVPTFSGPNVQESLGPQIRDTRRVSLENFGGGSANRIAEAGRVVQGVAQEYADYKRKEQKKANEVVVRNFESELQDYANKNLAQARNTRGENAFGASDKFSEEFKKKYDELSKQYFKNDEQKALGNEVFQGALVSARNQLFSHEAREGMRYQVDSLDSYTNVFSETAKNSYENPGELANSFEKIQTAVTAKAEVMGWSDAETKEELDRKVSDTHTGVITRMLTDNKAPLAKEYFKQNKDRISSDDYAKIKGALEEGSYQAESQMKASEIMSKHQDMGSALEAARKIKDPELQDRVVRRVKTRFNEQEEIKRDEIKKNYNNAYEILVANKSYDSIPANVLANLDVNQKEKLKSIEDKLLNGNDTSDLEVYYELELLASNPETRNNFLQLNLLDYRDKLSASDFKKIASWQSDAMSDKGKARLDGIESKANIVNSALRAMDIDYSAKANKKNAVRSANFRRKVDELVMQKQEETGRKVNNQELRDIVETLSVEVITDRNLILWDDRKKVFELSPEETAELDFEDIPLGQRQKVMQALQYEGIDTPTEDDIVERYAEMLNRVR